MNAGDILRSNEDLALNNNQFINHVGGKTIVNKSLKHVKRYGAMGFITVILIFFLFLFGMGNIIPSAISERLIEETDVQYADAVESKKLVFQQALYSGDIPDDTVKILKNNGVLVGNMQGGDFIEQNHTGSELALKIDDRVISAKDFIEEISTNVKLYNAFNSATYSRAAYYYDETANKIINKIGTNRNNYKDNSDYDKVMNGVIGSGSKISINTVSLVEETETNENGETETTYKYEENGARANSTDDVSTFIEQVRQKNTASNKNEAALYTADELKVADTIAKEQRSSLFFLAFMENISKMKAGDGNDAKTNEAMNYLYESAETKITDINTGEIITYSGTPLESPSLYAILANKEINVKDVENFSSDRILLTIENQINNHDNIGIISETVASTKPKTNGSIGRFIDNNTETAPEELISKIEHTVDNSLINNSYDTIKGINAGEFLVEGAINVGKELAKGSGGSPGDADAVIKYARLNSSVLAMDAAIDRMNRNPFDVTSPNTFLGSVVYKLAFGLKNTGKIAGISIMSSLLKNTLVAISSFIPSSFADGVDGYLSNFGETCETYARYGVVGSAQCAEIITFDTSTLNDPFNDTGFIDFVEQNTTINEFGERIVKPSSVLANYLLFNNERETPFGIVDGGIIKSLSGGLSSVPFVSDILSMIEEFLKTSEDDKRIATGEAFVNSINNPDWQIYKYAQRYVSLARATAALRRYSDNSSAYNNIKFFEGDKDPVMAFLNDYYAFND